MEKEIKPKTLEELQQWLEYNCYDSHIVTTSIPSPLWVEAMVFGKSKMKDERGEWYVETSDERGNSSVIERFRTESELIDYAMEHLTNSGWNWWKSHIVARTLDMMEAQMAKLELMLRGIRYEQNNIEYYTGSKVEGGKPLYRIFVFGRDVLKLEDFKKKHLHDV